MILPCDLITCCSNEGACFQRLKPKCDVPLSKFAFKFNLRRYNKVGLLTEITRKIADRGFSIRNVTGRPLQGEQFCMTYELDGAPQAWGLFSH